MKPDLPLFRPRAPWWGADLQTLRNFLRPPRPRLDPHPSRRLALAMSDGSGDALSGLLQRPATGARGPLLVLIHGLSGNEESSYMKATAAHFLERGHPALRINLRGAGPSRPLCRLQYHAGRTSDLRDALQALRAELLGEGLVLGGYSLGGNLLLKFLAEYGDAFPIRAAASVSAPIDLAAAARRFLEPRNRLYQWHMIRRMKQECLAPGAYLSESERRSVRAARSVYEFDDRFVAPRNGYASAEAYYEANMARRFLDGIRTPTLVIHALDDPWIPAGAYTSYAWDRNPSLLPLLPPSGGHVGFHDRECAPTWHDRCIEAFIDTV
jgi:predicted alpha/beta-fold hydrolase